MLTDFEERSKICNMIDVKTCFTKKGWFYVYINYESKKVFCLLSLELTRDNWLKTYKLTSRID